MNTLEYAFEWMLAAGLRVSLIIPIVFAARWLLRKRLPANWCYALWLPVSVVLLVPVIPLVPVLPNPTWPAAYQAPPTPAPATPVIEEFTVTGESSDRAIAATPVPPEEPKLVAQQPIPATADVTRCRDCGPRGLPLPKPLPIRQWVLP